MTSREQTLALVLLGAVLLVAGGGGGYMFILKPLERQRADEAKLNEEIDGLEKQLTAQKGVAKRLADARVHSLPADENLARREYIVALEHLADSSGLKGYTINKKNPNNATSPVSEISKGKPAYTRVNYEIVLKKAGVKEVKDFLVGYYKLGLMQQITNISITRSDDGGKTGRRDDLTVAITTEAIIVDGAENRRTLLPVPSAFAAAGGGAMYKALTLTPEAARGVVSPLPYDVLSPVGRDYDLLVLKDPFHGPPPPVAPFKMGELSAVKVKTDEKPSPVKVDLSGDGATGAKVVALVSEKSTLFAPGELKVDPKTHTIELPKTAATEGTAEIQVIATSAEGVTQKGSFKVSLEAPKVEETKTPEKEDISPYVLLVGVTRADDGTAWALVSDNANRKRYRIEVEKAEFWSIPLMTFIGVTKEEYREKDLKDPKKPQQPGWKAAWDHKYDPGVLVVSDFKSKTYRMFKVIAVEHGALVLADLRPDGSRPPPPRFGGGGFGPGGFPPGGMGGMGGAPPRVVGNGLVLLTYSINPPAPKYYRWPAGQPLTALKPLPDKEAKEILKQAEAHGPLLDVAVADR